MRKEMKALPDRIVAVLSRLGGRGYQVREGSAVYSESDDDFDPDPDSDVEGSKPQNHRR